MICGLIRGIGKESCKHNFLLIRNYPGMFMAEVVKFKSRVRGFIDAYKNEASLWQTSHCDYNNNHVRNLAYDRLVIKLKEVEDSPDRNMVVRKINSLRSAFRREYRKKVYDPNYEPRLWYYDHMLFIADQSINTRKVTNGRKKSVHLTAKTIHSKKDFKTFKINQETLQLQPESENEENIDMYEEEQAETEMLSDNNDLMSVKQEGRTATQVEVLEVTNIDSVEQEGQKIASTDHHDIENNEAIVQTFHHPHQPQHTTFSQQHSSSQTQHNSPHPVSIQSISLSRDQLQAFLNSNTSITSTPLTSSTIQQFLDDTPQTTKIGGRQKHDDEFDAVGFVVASKLRSMSHTQRIIAEKLISDILFNGQLESLTVGSKIT